MRVLHALHDLLPLLNESWKIRKKTKVCLDFRFKQMSLINAIKFEIK